jgi:hypothetical protein
MARTNRSVTLFAHAAYRAVMFWIMIRILILLALSLPSMSTPDLRAQTPERLAAPDNNVDVASMGKDAQTLFARDARPLRRIVAAAFAPDGNRIALITESSTIRNGRTAQEECIGWIYTLDSQRLNRVAGSSLPKSCARHSPYIAWEGEDVYVHFVDYDTFPFQEGAMRWHDAEAAQSKGEDLPVTFRKALARKVANQKAEYELQNALGDDMAQVTTDGRFWLLTGQGEGRQCFSLVASPKERDWKQILSTCSIPTDYILDPDNNLVVLFDSRSLAQQHERFTTVTVFDLKSHTNRKFSVPDIDPLPDLLAEDLLANGEIRIAYAVRGGCDAANSNYANDPVGICFAAFAPK